MTKLRSRKNAFLARRLRGLDEDDVAALARAAEILERLLEDERPIIRARSRERG
jgi:hypothetical protein